MRLPRIALQLALTALVFSTQLNAQAARPVALSGIVVVGDAPGTPVSGADILLAALGQMVTTDSVGRFTVTGLERGKSYEVIVTRIGLQQQLLQLDVGDTDSVAVQITMEQEPMELAGVDVMTERPNPRLSDYYANRKAGRGRAVPREEIETTFRGQRMVDVMRNFSTHVRIVRTARGFQLASRRGSISGPMGSEPSALSSPIGAPCFLRVFVDGVDQKTTNLLDFDMPTEQIEAIELFAGADIPLRYVSVGNACGVVNIIRRVSP